MNRILTININEEDDDINYDFQNKHVHLESFDHPALLIAKFGYVSKCPECDDVNGNGNDNDKNKTMKMKV